MAVDVKESEGRFEAEGHDEVGRFTLTGERRGPSNRFRWTKSYIGQHSLDYRGQWHDDHSGFVGRWFLEGRCGGTFALWPGLLEIPPLDLLRQLPSNDVRFKCLCGRDLDIEAVGIGTELECPWCAKVVIAPDDGEPAVEAAPKPDPGGEDRPEWPLCPTCASPCSSERCGLCEIPVDSKKRRMLLHASRSQSVISPESADWIIRKVSWLIRRVTFREFSRPKLVLPTSEWFPEPWKPTRKALEPLLARLQRYAGLEGVPLTLGIRRDELDSVRLPDDTSRSSGAAGCFIAPAGNRQEFRIEVRRGLLEDRLALVATLSHELGHLYLHQRFGMNRDRRPPDSEFLTDLVSIMLGFGYFTCEAAFRFQAWGNGNGDGWSISTLGYLNQSDRCFALALWGTLLERDLNPLIPHLGINSKAYLKQSLRFFEDQRDLLEKLRHEGTLEEA